MDEIPWYRSRVFIGALTTWVSLLVGLFPKVGVWLHIKAPSDIDPVVEFISSTIGLVALSYALIRRVKQPVMQKLVFNKPSPPIQQTGSPPS